MTIAPSLQTRNPLITAQPNFRTAIELTAGPLGVSGSGVTWMPVESIFVSASETNNHADLEGLVDSVRERGIVTPLMVAADGRLIAGRRRLAVAHRLGLQTVPVYVQPIADERTVIETGLMENLHRTEPDPFSRARSYRDLIELGASVEEVADLVGETTVHVHQYLSLLDMHPDVQKAIQERTLSLAQAKTFTVLEIDQQPVVLDEILRAGKPVTFRQAKALVDAHRVMSLVPKRHATKDNAERKPEGNYDLLTREAGNGGQSARAVMPTALDELSAVIAELVAAAQDEDMLRRWARRLSQILARLREDCDCQGQPLEKVPYATQDRLL